MSNIRFTSSTKRQSLWASLSMAGLLALGGTLGGNVLAASDDAKSSPPASDRMSRETPASETAKPGVPSKSEMADSAFKKLDASGKGYVAKSDTKALEGFDKIFDKVDSKNTGKLTYPQFRQAWQQYAGQESTSPSTGKAAY